MTHLKEKSQNCLQRSAWNHCVEEVDKWVMWAVHSSGTPAGVSHLILDDGSLLLTIFGKRSKCDKQCQHKGFSFWTDILITQCKQRKKKGNNWSVWKWAVSHMRGIIWKKTFSLSYPSSPLRYNPLLLQHKASWNYCSKKVFSEMSSDVIMYHFITWLKWSRVP